MGRELSGLHGCYCTAEGGLAATSGLHIDGSIEGYLGNISHLHALLFGSGNRVDASILLAECLELLVADHLALEHILDRLEVAIAYGMNLGERNNEQMVVVAALVERRHLAGFGLEHPLHGITGAAYTSHEMLRVEHILALQNFEAILGCGLLHRLDGLVLAHKLAELVVGSRIGCLGEIDGMLHYGSHILVGECLAVGHLNDDVTLGQGHVLQFACGRGSEGFEIVLGICIDGTGMLIHAGGKPLLFASLTIGLGDGREISTTLKRLDDAVGTVVGLVNRCATHLNLTILYAVGELHLGDEFHHIEGIVHHGLEGSRGLTYGH